MTRTTIFALLTGVHLAGILFSPDALSPFFAESAYLPLTALDSVGIPVLAAGEPGGWVSPSVLGWGLVAIIWAGVWWIVTLAIAKLLGARERIA